MEDFKYEIIGMYYPTKGSLFDYSRVTNSKREAKKYFREAQKKYYYASIIIRNEKRIPDNLKAEDNYNSDERA